MAVRECGERESEAVGLGGSDVMEGHGPRRWRAEEGNDAVDDGAKLQVAGCGDDRLGESHNGSC